MARLRELRKVTSLIAKSFQAVLSEPHTAKEIDRVLREAKQSLQETYSKRGPRTVSESSGFEYQGSLASSDIILHPPDEDCEDEKAFDDGAERDDVEVAQVIDRSNSDANNQESPPATIIPLCDALSEILEIQKELRRIPVISLAWPSVVLVGAPNVGKSSLVRAVSSGTPEVNNYPFTTRGVTVGHVIYADVDLRVQVMDTPGLLNRPEEERNEMEMLTFASMYHLPTAVIFVVDAIGHAGDRVPLAAQLQIRREMRARFPKRPWLDVLSKADLIDFESLVNSIVDNDVREEFAEVCRSALRVSVVSEENVSELRQRIRLMAESVQEFLEQNINK